LGRRDEFETESCSKTNCSFVNVSDEPSFNSEKLQALGWKCKPLEETLKDSVESYRKAGALD
jgi:nucleoside-diphosphate-sugar epimerase